eukprot:6177475-Pleurochrysis_carterae.AAC.9
MPMRDGLSNRDCVSQKSEKCRAGVASASASSVTMLFAPSDPIFAILLQHATPQPVEQARAATLPKHLRRSPRTEAERCARRWRDTRARSERDVTFIPCI